MKINFAYPCSSHYFSPQLHFAHCLGCTRVHVAMVSTTGHSKMAAESVNTYAPKAVSKILGDTTDGENVGTNGRNY